MRNARITRIGQMMNTTGRGMVQGAIGLLAHPPTPEFHFLIVFAGNSNYGEGYIEKVVIQKCQ